MSGGRLPDEYLGGKDTPKPVMSPYNRALKTLTDLGNELIAIGVTSDLAWLDLLREDVRVKAIADIGIDPTPYDGATIEERFPVGTRLRWVENEGLSFRHPSGYPPPLATIVNWSPVWWQGMGGTEPDPPKPKLYYSDRLEVVFDGDDEITSMNAYLLVSAFARVTE